VKICSDLTYDGTDGTLCEIDHNTEEDGIEKPCIWDESNTVNKICRVKVCKDLLGDEECISWSYDDCDWYKSGCDKKRNSEDCEDLGKSICSDGENCIWESNTAGCRCRKCSEISKENCISLSSSASDGPCFIKEDEECGIKVCGDILNDEECIEGNVISCDWYNTGCDDKQESGECSDFGRNICSENDCNWDDEYGCSHAKYCEDIRNGDIPCIDFSHTASDGPCYWDGELCKGVSSCSELSYASEDICNENHIDDGVSGDEPCFWTGNSCREKECSDFSENDCKSFSNNPSSRLTCLWDALINLCSQTCSDTNLYEAINGVCIPKSECNLIIPNLGFSVYPCGFNTGCVFEENICKSSCSTENHYTAVNGVCELELCTSRIPKMSGDNRCGKDGCYFEGDSCHFLCSNPAHYIMKKKKVGCVG
jgi:hypothetical protein